jgi:hypothetical protein
MDRLTPDQARKVHDALGPTTGYLARLRERMERADLSLGGPLPARDGRTRCDALA